ncbi:hypothetical protein [Paraglaciecola sp.]|uniref:hypothetical protein n=1 Tax=Paraglaciecola sp. TaxID=1920173 RepID=UPI003267EFA8
MLPRLKCGGAENECRADKHFVTNQNNQQILGYGELAGLAANQAVSENVVLKSKAEYKYIGRDLACHNQDKIVVGKLTYGIDTKLPSLKYAAFTHCRVLGGKLKSIDETALMKITGMSNVIEIPHFNVPFGSIGSCRNC